MPARPVSRQSIRQGFLVSEESSPCLASRYLVETDLTGRDSRSNSKLNQMNFAPSVANPETLDEDSSMYPWLKQETTSNRHPAHSSSNDQCATTQNSSSRMMAPSGASSQHSPFTVGGSLSKNRGQAPCVVVADALMETPDAVRVVKIDHERDSILQFAP